MSAIMTNNGQPSFLGICPTFKFYDEVHVEQPAPEVYEQWRLSDVIRVCDGWWYVKPTAQILEVKSYTDAMKKADWSRDMTHLHAECKTQAASRWRANRPWFCS